MKLRSPSLIELHAFLAVYRLGSFRQAAEELCVTQAAVSRAVLRLEEHFGGCRLFRRTSRSLAPTEQGEHLYHLTHSHVMGLEAAAITFRQRTARSTLRLSVIPTLGTQWLLPRLPRLHQACPGIELEWRQFRHNEDYTRDDVDAWIDLKRPHRPWPSWLHATYLLGRGIVPVCAPAMAPRVRSPQDLTRMVLLHHTLYPQNWALWLRKAGVAAPFTLGPGFDLTINLVVAARSGAGVAVVPRCLVEHELAQGELVAPLDREVETDRGYYLCVRQPEALPDSVRQFRDWLLAEAGETATP